MESDRISETSGRSWVPPAVLVGIGYALVGIVFALPSTHVQAWRLAAWAVSAIGYGAHIVYELVRRHETPARAALHVAIAAGIGAFGLAVGANLHSLAVDSASQHRSLLRLSLGIWPIMIALPAFLVALVTSVLLTYMLGRRQDNR